MRGVDKIMVSNPPTNEASAENLPTMESPPSSVAEDAFHDQTVHTVAPGRSS